MRLNRFDEPLGPGARALSASSTAATNFGRWWVVCRGFVTRTRSRAFGIDHPAKHLRVRPLERWHAFSPVTGFHRRPKLPLNHLAITRHRVTGAPATHCPTLSVSAATSLSLLSTSSRRACRPALSAHGCCLRGLPGRRHLPAISPTARERPPARPFRLSDSQAHTRVRGSQAFRCVTASHPRHWTAGRGHGKYSQIMWPGTEHPVVETSGWQDSNAKGPCRQARHGCQAPKTPAFRQS